MVNESAKLMLDNTTIIELTPSIGRGSFGVGNAALNLAASLNRAGADIYLGCVDTVDEAQEACEQSGFPSERVVRGRLLGHPTLRFSPLLIRQLLNLPVRRKVLVHSHGLWTYMSRIAMKIREHHRCPLVVSPHGSLEPWALRISPRKKLIASLLYEHKNLSTASCIWALSEQEKQSARDYGLDGRIDVIANGANRASLCSEEEVKAFRGKYGIQGDSRILLFLSRITPVKGLPILLRAFAENLRRQWGWTLVIAGSDEGNHIEEVRQLVELLGIGLSVRMIGPVFGREKACAFSAASLFSLPSYHEGLPIAVLEAMEYGLPVIITDTWTLPCPVDKQFGWRVAAEQSALQNALFEAMTAPASRLEEIGAGAQSLARRYFTWDAVAQKASELYASLLSGIEG